MNNITRRDFVRAASSVATFAALPPSKTAAAGQTTKKTNQAVDPMALVDPELRPTLQGMLKNTSLPKIEGELSPAQLTALRKMMTLGQKPRLQQPAVIERTVHGRAGAPHVRVFVINSKPGERRPAILHTHGGGYLLGSAA